MNLLRSLIRRALHQSVLRCGFELRRVKPFEAAIKKFELTSDDFYFVQVGAHNGVTSDPFSSFLQSPAWSAVLIEPQRQFTEILKTIYCDRDKIRVVNAAVGPTNGSMLMYMVRPDAENVPYWATQLASFNFDVIVGHEDRIPGLRDLIISVETPCQTLQSILQESGFPRLDLLAIDVEGYDFQVVKQIDSLPFLPRFLYYEHGHLTPADQQQCVDFLVQRKYKTSTVNNGDTFAELVR